MEIVNKILDFIFDSSRKLSHKAITIMIIVIAVLVIDNIYSITYYYNLNKKIETIKNLNPLISDTTVTPKEKEVFLRLRLDVINHTTIKEKLFNLSNSIIYSDNQVSPGERGLLFFHYFSVNLIIFLIWFIIDMIVVKSFFKDVNFKTSKKSAIVVMAILAIFVNIILYYITLLVFKASSYVPIIDGKEYINYIIYTALNLILFILGCYDKDTKTFNFRFWKPIAIDI